MNQRQTTPSSEALASFADDIGKPLYFIRLTPNEKWQHLLFVISFIMLAFTGFMVWLPEEAFHFLGRAKETVFIARGVLHRIFGILMVLVSLYHAGYLVIAPGGRRWLADMLPGIKDIRDFTQNISYYVGIRKSPPEFDRFSYKQKAEYGALIAGTTLMSISGLLLWMESLWNKFFVDIAALIHGMEAVLACLAVMVWHLYEVHLRPRKFPIDNLWLTGIIDEEEMKEEYAFHYKKIMADPELRKIYISKG